MVMKLVKVWFDDYGVPAGSTGVLLVDEKDVDAVVARLKEADKGEYHAIEVDDAPTLDEVLQLIREVNEDD